MTDPQVEGAIKSLAPRFLAHGVEYADFVRTTGQIERWVDWLDAWVATGDSHLQLGEEAEAQSHRQTAGEAYVRAALCYHFGKFLWLEELQKYWAATDRSAATLARGRRLLDPTFERLEVPFDRDEIVANIRAPVGAQRPPVVILVPGLDSTKEELSIWEHGFLARGLATVAMDGPGQGEAGEINTIRPDYEAPVAALLDALNRRGDLNLSRVGIVGPGLGGYYAARAAAFEPRIGAVSMIGSPFTLALRSPTTLQKFMHAARIADEDRAHQFAARFTLDGLPGRVTQPLLVIHGQQDAVMPWKDAERMAREAPNGELLLYPEGGTACHTVHHLYKPYLADWMQEKLGA